MPLKYKTKPLTLPKAVDEIWLILLEQDETINILIQEIKRLNQRVKQLERNDTNAEAETKRLS